MVQTKIRKNSKNRDRPLFISNKSLQPTQKAARLKNSVILMFYPSSASPNQIALGGCHSG